MLHLLWQQLVWPCVLAAVPGGPFLGAGVIHIDQRHAMTGNVTPGDQPGFPITISQPGSYRLSGNLTVPDLDTTAIQITSDGVTLDLNGFSIIGPGVCTTDPTKCPSPGKGVGVQSGGDEGARPRGVRITNGTVRGMGLIGIWLTGDGSVVEKVTADSNAGGGLSVAGSVIGSAAIQNGSLGIIGNTVRDSSAVQNFGDGILLQPGGVATGNVSSTNGGYGIALPYGTATGNTLFLNKSFGISAICPSSMVGNTIVSGESLNVETTGDGCVQANNATRP
jgi:hypothetical protein